MDAGSAVRDHSSVPYSASACCTGADCVGQVHHSLLGGDNNWDQFLDPLSYLPMTLILDPLKIGRRQGSQF